jgi:hypothetical protein
MVLLLLVMLMMQQLGMHGPSTTDRWGTGKRL